MWRSWLERTLGAHNGDDYAAQRARRHEELTGVCDEPASEEEARLMSAAAGLSVSQRLPLEDLPLRPVDAAEPVTHAAMGS